MMMMVMMMMMMTMMMMRMNSIQYKGQHGPWPLGLV